MKILVLVFCAAMLAGCAALGDDFGDGLGDAGRRISKDARDRQPRPDPIGVTNIRPF